MRITHVGWWYTVRIQPVHRSVGAAYTLRNVESVTQAAVCAGLAASVLSIQLETCVDPAGIRASHTSGDTMWCSYSRLVDHWVPHTLYVTSNPLHRPPSVRGSRQAFYRYNLRPVLIRPVYEHHTHRVIPCGAHTAAWLTIGCRIHST